MAYTFDEKILSDLHKDARGFRPSQQWMQTWAAAPNAEKQRIWDNLCSELDSELERERQEQARAVEAFERGVASALMLGAANRETAIRWVIEGLELDVYDLQYGGSKICFELGLPYSMAGIFDPICKDLLGWSK